MANEKLKNENRIYKQNISKNHIKDSPSSTLSHEEYNIPGSLTPPQSYISVSSPERSDSVSSPPTSPDIVINSQILVKLITNFYLNVLLHNMNVLLNYFYNYRAKNLVKEVWLIIQD